MKKVLLNKCYGGFDVSEQAYLLYAKKQGLELFKYSSNFVNEEGRTKVIYIKCDNDNLTIPDVFCIYTTKDLGDRVYALTDVLELDGSHREDPLLIEIVEELGDKANGRFGFLKIVEIPDDVAEDYVVDNYDGYETLHKNVQEW